jgi:hypothetical protein
MRSNSGPTGETSDHPWDRRGFLGKSSAVFLGTALAGRMEAQTSEDIQKIEKALHDKSATDAGAENQALKDSNPNTFMPSPTDRGEVQTFWSSFSAARRAFRKGAILAKTFFLLLVVVSLLPHR